MFLGSAPKLTTLAPEEWLSKCLGELVRGEMTEVRASRSAVLIEPLFGLRPAGGGDLLFLDLVDEVPVADVVVLEVEDEEFNAPMALETDALELCVNFVERGGCVGEVGGELGGEIAARCVCN